MDFLGSKAAAILSLRQIGAYLFLLCRQWDSDDGYLPLDDTVLGAFSRLGDTFQTEGRAIIEQCFEVRGNKTWNARLRSAWLKYREHSKASQRGGVNSGRSRRKHIEGPLDSTSKWTPSNQNQNQNHKQTDTNAREEQSPPSPKRRKRERGHGTDDTPQTRQGCDDLAAILGRKPDYTTTTLGLFARLLREGRTREQWMAVLMAYRDQSTDTAVFCRKGDGKRLDSNGKSKGPGLVYLLRPGDSGGFDKVWIQLHEQTEEPARVKAPWEDKETA